MAGNNFAKNGSKKQGCRGKANEPIPPFDEIAERGLVTSPFVVPDRFAEVADITPRHFYRDDYRALWGAMQEVYAAGGRITSQAIISKMNEDSALLAAIGGPGALPRIVDGADSGANITYFAGKVRTAYRLRELQRKFLEGSERISRGESLEEMATFVGDLTKTPATAKPKRLVYLTGDQLKLENYPLVPLVRDVFYANHTSVIAALEKNGKTTAGLHLSLCLATGMKYMNRFDVPKPVKVIFYSGESGEATLIQNAILMCESMGVELTKIPNFILSPTVPRIGDPSYMAEFEADIHEMKPAVAIIDPFNKALECDRPGDMFAVGKLLLEAQEICKPVGTTLFYIHHVRKPDRMSRTQPLTLQDLAYSGLSQDVRQWILIERREEFDKPAADLAATLERSATGEEAERVRTRLRDSVVRPLRQASQRMSCAADSSQQMGEKPLESLDRTGTLPTLAPDGLEEQIWELALAATTLCVQLGDEPGLQEATAALQDLALDVDDPAVTADRLTELQRLQAGLEPEIRVAHNGPYFVTNAYEMVNWLGETYEIRPQMALCRCGGSASKPFCDGTHARIGFRDAKDPKRVADRRDRYQGVRVTILDNRGLCAHSGFCTDRLASVFHLGQEPFVTPSGARMDDIVRAIRSCPSGALSYAVGEHEEREVVDQERLPTIEVSKDGPYRITGAIPLVAHDGSDVVRNEGASREHYSLCRCGQSQNKPFCRGMHYYVNFVDPQPDPEHEPTLFEWAGGLPALLRMTRIFYEKYVPEEPLLSPLFADMSPDHPQRVAAWLGEVFGGPKSYSDTYGGYERMLSQHIGKAITEDKRARWVQLLCRSADEAGLPADAEFRAAFTAYLEWGSRLAVENSTPGAKPPPHMPMPRWWWVCDATPGARISALAPPAEEDQPAALPTPNEAVSFDQHIKPLFRSTDRRSMQFAFDLWSYDDVRTHAAAILERLRAGTMPCDGAWPAAKIDVFQRWIDAGKLQ